MKAAHPTRVILFGSAARGGRRVPHDADLLVISGSEVQRPRKESIRIRRALRGIPMPMDILVISERQLREVADQPGLVYREALRVGKIVYDASA